jgi:hypothetical protein
MITAVVGLSMAAAGAIIALVQRVEADPKNTPELGSGWTERRRPGLGACVDSVGLIHLFAVRQRAGLCCAERTAR